MVLCEQQHRQERDPVGQGRRGVENLEADVAIDGDLVELEFIFGDARPSPQRDVAIGEIWTRGPNVTKGYWEYPEANAASFDEGYLYIVDPHCAERLAKFKVPRSVVFVDSFPHNATGKLLERELRTNHGNEGNEC